MVRKLVFITPTCALQQMEWGVAASQATQQQGVPSCLNTPKYTVTASRRKGSALPPFVPRLLNSFRWWLRHSPEKPEDMVDRIVVEEFVS